MTRIRPARIFSLFIFMPGLMLFSPGVFAYLDPSTGSMVVSAIVGIFASIALALKTYWYKVKRFFRRGHEEKSTESDPID